MSEHSKYEAIRISLSDQNIMLTTLYSILHWSLEQSERCRILAEELDNLLERSIIDDVDPNDILRLRSKRFDIDKHEVHFRHTATVIKTLIR